MNQSVLPGVTLPQLSQEEREQALINNDFLFSDDFDELPHNSENQCLLPGFCPADFRPDGEQFSTDQALRIFEQEPSLAPMIIIGLGMGETSLSPEAARHLREAEVLALPRRLLAHFRGHTAHLVVLASPLEKALQKLEAFQRQGLHCVVLADGDPLLYGIGATLSKRLAASSLRIMSGVSAMQTACSRMALPWHDIATVSLHGRNNWLPLAHATLTGRPICLYTDAAHHPGRVAQFLLERGVDWFRMVVAEQLASPHERLRYFDLHQAAHHDFSGGETVLLLPEGLPRGPRLGIDESTLLADGDLYTKASVRAAALSLLSLSPAAIMWDIGAGSGALALEAAALLPRGQVWAVEQNPQRIIHIQENRRRLGVPHLEILTATAPLGLKALPDPDAIFLGGGLGSGKNDSAATKLLSTLLARLKPGGTLVAACTLLASLNVITAFLEKRQFSYSVSLIQTSHSAPLASSLTLKPINPIFLIKTSL